jgi:diaminopimelate epimerase
MSDDGRPGLQLTKLEGAGNDFLVLVAGDVAPLTPGEIRALCDRRRGVGADGVITLGPGAGGADVSMLLANADGLEAEMSGNGIRCLAYVAVQSGLVDPPSFRVSTAAGVRTVTYSPGRPGEAWASVDMGSVSIGSEVTPDIGARAQRADVGNPHVVVLVKSVGDVDLAVDGPRLEQEFDGVNVEFIAPRDGREELDLVVWERGAGATLACGTGSVASAAVARRWGLVKDCVRVHNPGGTLEVLLDADERGTTVLAGPVRKVADVVVDRASLQ